MLAAELVALRVDLIIANGDTPTVTAAVGAARKTPIVFLWGSDPVVAPKITRTAVITNSAANDLAAPRRLMQLASQSLGVQLSLFDVQAPSDLAKALEQVALAHVHGILVQDGYMILNSANPGDLPVEQPTRFELVIDSRTAKTLGLPIPNSMLMRADRVLR